MWIKGCVKKKVCLQMKFGKSCTIVWSTVTYTLSSCQDAKIFPLHVPYAWDSMQKVSYKDIRQQWLQTSEHVNILLICDCSFCIFAKIRWQFMNQGFICIWQFLKHFFKTPGLQLFFHRIPTYLVVMMEKYFNYCNWYFVVSITQYGALYFLYIMYLVIHYYLFLCDFFFLYFV